jgi:serine/threonine protein kinase
MSDNIGGDTIKVPDEPDDKGNLDVKSGPPSYIDAIGGDTIKSDSVKAAEAAALKAKSDKQPSTAPPAKQGQQVPSYIDAMGGDTIKSDSVKAAEAAALKSKSDKQAPSSAPPSKSNPTTPASYNAPLGGDTIKSDSVIAAEAAALKTDSQKAADAAKADSKNPKSSSPKSDSQGGTLRKPPSSSKSRLDDIPEEAATFADDPNRQLTSYILVKQIGKGGMGAVWKAWDKKLTRWVAIKFLLVAEDEDVMRFQREAKLAARLRHPNIAPIYEVGEAPATQAGAQTRHYLAMEYIDGNTMASAIGLPIPELLDIFMKVAQGMEAAHKAGVVHRDLKPANIMLTSDKWPYVMDFGLAKAIQAESSISVSGAVMGTPAYMPPEQAEGRLDFIDAQSDVYSLGATMYAVLCKKQPFTGQTPMEILMKVCKEEPVAPRTHNPEIPEQVEKILLKAMAKEKAERYASALALAEDLKRFLSNQEIEAKGPSSLKIAAKKAKKNVWPIFVVLLLLAGGGVFGWQKYGPKPPVPEPPPTNTNTGKTDPPPEDPKAKVAVEWYNSWSKLAESVDYDFWKPGDATLAERINKHLQAMASDAPVREGEVRFWFGSQTSKADDLLKEVRNSRDAAAAAKLVGWCDTLLGTLKGIEYLSRYQGQMQKTRDAAALIANFKGSFTLKIMVLPYVEVTKLTTGGKDFPLTQRGTPLMIGGIEVGDVVVELTHPTLGKRVEKLPASTFKDQKVYQLNGSFKDAKLRVRELP